MSKKIADELIGLHSSPGEDYGSEMAAYLKIMIEIDENFFKEKEVYSLLEGVTRTKGRKNRSEELKGLVHKTENWELLAFTLETLKLHFGIRPKEPLIKQIYRDISAKLTKLKSRKQR